MILKDKQTTFIVTIGTFFAFLIFGFADNLKDPILPVLLKEFNLFDAQGSNILLILYLGFMLSIPGSGFIAGKYGNRNVLLLAGVIILVSVIGMSRVQDQFFLYPLYFLVGISPGRIAIDANGVITDTYHENNEKFLNLLAFFHSVSSMADPWLFGIFPDQQLPE